MKQLLFTAYLLLCSLPFVQAQSTSFTESSTSFTEKIQFRPMPYKKPASPGKSSKPSTVAYSQSAKAGNLITPAILMGLPAVVILALIFMSLKND